jgi:hypothetical protein
MNLKSVRRLARPRSLVGALFGLLVVALPTGILYAFEQYQLASDRERLQYGIGVEILIGLLILRQFGALWLPYARVTTLLYLGAFIVLWSAKPLSDHWLTPLAYGLFTVVPLTLIALQELLSSGSATHRKARFLVHQIAKRTNWPTLEETRKHPDGLQLRDLLQDDPTPAIALLGHPRPEVQLCALAALQYRPRWRRIHAQILLQTAQASTQPLIRSSALTALANVEDPMIVNALVPYLRDSSMEVRRAAAGALLWKSEKHWTSIRSSLRASLSDPKCARDGAFPCLTTLPPQALNDLTVWAGEIGSVGQRATLTLTTYYRRIVREERNTSFCQHLANQMVQTNVPAAVRVEIGYMLRDQGWIDHATAEKLLVETQPGPLRIIAADIILNHVKDQRAIEVLKEIARQPNRELSLAAAVVIQKSLRVDLGLPLGEDPPAPNSKQAAEVVRQVMQWAQQHDLEPKKDDESIDFDLPNPRKPSRV